MSNHLLITKKTCFFYLFITCSISVIAQKPELNIFAGPQASSAKYTVTGEPQSTSHKYGFQAGMGIKIPFETNLYFSPAVFYSLKGYKVDLTSPSYPPNPMATDNNTTIHTAELACLLQYDIGKSANHMFLRAGPSLDFQRSGKETFHLNNNSTVEQGMKYSFADYGRYAANLLMQLGYESKSGFMLFAQYSYGFISLNNADGGPKIYHRVFGLSIGKCFRSDKIVLDTRNKE